jgi:ABC-type uncharacterized transport system, permease component, COG4587
VIIFALLIYIGCSAVGFITPHVWAVGLCALATLSGMAVAYLMGFLIAMLAFWMDEVWTLFVMKNLVLWFLTGQLVPLDMFPEAIRQASKFLPFGYLAYFPTKVLTVALPLSEIISGLCIILSWVVMFYIAYKLFWNYALRKYGAFGG